jgi:hypothetical protein
VKTEQRQQGKNSSPEAQKDVVEGMESRENFPEI